MLLTDAGDDLPPPRDPSPDPDVIAGTGGQIQMVRTTNAVYTNASLALISRINEVVISLEELREKKYDEPREKILEGHERIKWNEEHAIYDADDEIHRNISRLVLEIITPNELPHRKIGEILKQAWYTLKFEIASAAISRKPPSDTVITACLEQCSIDPFALTESVERGPSEVPPTNAIDFAKRASAILSERIDVLMQCIHEIHHFTASISPLLTVPSFSHHVAFAT
jgi:hypothetical protein